MSSRLILLALLSLIFCIAFSVSANAQVTSPPPIPGLPIPEEADYVGGAAPKQPVDTQYQSLPAQGESQSHVKGAKPNRYKLSYGTKAQGISSRIVGKGNVSEREGLEGNEQNSGPPAVNRLPMNRTIGLDAKRP